MDQFDISNIKISFNPNSSEFSPIDNEKENQIWISVFEAAKGISFKTKAQILFKDRGFGDLDEKLFENILNRHILELRESAWIEGWELPVEGHEDWKSKIFDDIYSKTCSEIALEQNRKDLLGWAEKAGKGKALFVDCLMGLGKTYSIAKVLGQNPNLSAVIFMPTNRLCQNMVQDLKTEILRNNPNLRFDYPDVVEQEESVDENDEVIWDTRVGIPVFRWTRDFLINEVYFADGINKTECSYFDDIIKRYRQNWIRKRDICAKCTKRDICRFIKHDTEAPKSRIVVTTHQQYDRFYKLPAIRKWFKGGCEKEGVSRDYFIVDEDIVLSKCYHPVYLTHNEIGDFIDTLLKFLEGHEKESEFENKINKLYTQSSLPSDTSVIPPIDSEFNFPDDVKQKWNKSFSDFSWMIPEDIDKSEVVGNHLELIENAIRKGFVVQKYGQRNRIYFTNTKKYDLSDLPPHVFFDGTKLDDKFLEKKLIGVGFDKLFVQIKLLWNFRVKQNIYTDLPKGKSQKEQEHVKRLLYDLIRQEGVEKKFFFITKKRLRQNYLDEFLKSQSLILPGLNYIIQHYGNLRGINDANDCSVGVMLGSYNLSDAVELAMGLESISDQLPKNRVPTKNYFWTQKDTNSRRSYLPEYSDVEKLSKGLRHSEQRQAIARTRYLFHDVDFYVLSKDRVDDYEKYAKVIEYQYRADLFPPRIERSDNKYEDVKEAVFQLINENGWAREMEIHRRKGWSRTIIRTHLKRMLEEGLLFKDGTKYKRRQQIA